MGALAADDGDEPQAGMGIGVLTPLDLSLIQVVPIACAGVGALLLGVSWWTEGLPSYVLSAALLALAAVALLIWGDELPDLAWLLPAVLVPVVVAELVMDWCRDGFGKTTPVTAMLITVQAQRRSVSGRTACATGAGKEQG